MALGATVRARLGRFETPVADAYRAAFINLDDFVDTVTGLADPARVLEVGCGDGQVADRVCRAWPSATYIGTDLVPDPGRRYAGDPSRVTFRTATTAELVAEGAGGFDVVLIVDVLHHVPTDAARRALLGDAARMTAPGGLIMVKEWEALRNTAHLAAFTSDRYVSGDTGVRFCTGDQLTDLLSAGLPDCEPLLAARVPPHRNNVLRVLRRS